tara:strand:- start:649 stop:1185 length:537 start_codon:yes stop_codon:yes gene_type:complete
MKKLVLLSALLIFCFSSFSQEVLDNQSVIDMIELGFDEQVIINKIESTNSSFETSLEELKSLKLLGVTQNILSIMIKESKETIPNEVVEYYDSGAIKSKTSYLDGVKQGEQINYYDSGEIKARTPYHYGKINGMRIFYYESGVIKELSKFDDGSQEHILFYNENGKMKYDYHGNLIEY